MIPSTKLLRPLLVGQLPGVELHCKTCGTAGHGDDAARAGWYADHDLEQQGQSLTQGVYCPEHALLEDLDPDWAGNQNTLYGIPVTRKMPLQGITDLGQLFEKPAVYRNMQAVDTARAKGERPRYWVHLPPGHNFWPHQFVDGLLTLQPVLDQMLYGSHGDYYIDVFFRENGTALLALKYQQILGQRFICIVEKQAVLDFFPQMPLA